MNWLFIFISIVSINTNANALSTSEAESLYDAGNYQQASEKYMELIESNGETSALWYNLGNSYTKQKKYGPAMDAYLKGRNLTSGDPDIEANMKFISDQFQDDLSPSKDLKGVEKLMSYVRFAESEWIGLLGGVFIFVSGLFLSVYAFRKKNVFLLPSGVSAILGTLLFSFFLYFYLTTEIWGAIRTKEASVFSGPNKNTTLLFKLKEGAPFIEKIRKGNWVKIELSNGKIGWLYQSYM